MAFQRTFESTMSEVRALEAEAKRITSAPSQTSDQKFRLISLDGEIRALRKISEEVNAREKEELRHAAERAIPVAGANYADAAGMDELRSYMLTGETRASLTTSNTGGYVLPNPVVERIISLAKDADPIIGGARRFNIDGLASSIEIPVQSADGAVAWAGETVARPETDSPTFALTTIHTYDVYGNWFATQQLLDSQPNVEDWLIEEAGRTLLQAAGVRFATGDGSSAIFGLFSNTTGYTERLSGSADVLVNTAFPSAFFDLPAVYHPGAVWVMSPATLSTCTTFDDPHTSATTPLVKFDNMGRPTIMGKPVLLCDNAPAVGDGAYPVFFGDLSRAYGIAVHRAVTLLRDPYTNKPYVGFYGILRIGGYPLDNKAGVLIKSDDS